jgi:hypothetical protein
MYYMEKVKQTNWNEGESKEKKQERKYRKTGREVERKTGRRREQIKIAFINVFVEKRKRSSYNRQDRKGDGEKER